MKNLFAAAAGVEEVKERMAHLRAASERYGGSNECRTGAGALLRAYGGNAGAVKNPRREV